MDDYNNKHECVGFFLIQWQIIRASFVVAELRTVSFLQLVPTGEVRCLVRWRQETSFNAMLGLAGTCIYIFVPKYCKHVSTACHTLQNGISIPKALNLSATISTNATASQSIPGPAGISDC